LASEKELKKIESSKKRIEFLASCADKFMQDFLAKALADDRLGSIVACARLAQLGAVLCAEYEANCNSLIDSETEKKVADQATEAVVRMVNKNAEECIAMLDDTKIVSPAGPLN
jgi:hypothetical protein